MSCRARHDSAATRSWTAAAQALERLADGRVSPALMPLLADGDAAVRGQAIELLGKLGDASAVEPLNRALEDPDPAVRERAAAALEQITARLGSAAPAWSPSAPR